MRVVLRDDFFHDGRGPELKAAHYSPPGSKLLAVDYVNPPLRDAPYGDLRHVEFFNAQVFMFTPEEVENYDNSPTPWAATNNGAAISLGRSSWLRSFAPGHLERCEHYRFMFYDEFLDIICEEARAKPGGYGQ